MQASVGGSATRSEQDSGDDLLTVAAMGAIACMLQTVLHEGLGHGVAAWLSGAQAITVSRVGMSAELDTRWISASGTLVNLIAALMLWAALRLGPEGWIGAVVILGLVFCLWLGR